MGLSPYSISPHPGSRRQSGDEVQMDGTDTRVAVSPEVDDREIQAKVYFPKTQFSDEPDELIDDCGSGCGPEIDNTDGIIDNENFPGSGSPTRLLVPSSHSSLVATAGPLKGLGGRERGAAPPKDSAASEGFFEVEIDGVDLPLVEPLDPLLGDAVCTFTKKGRTSLRLPHGVISNPDDHLALHGVAVEMIRRFVPPQARDVPYPRDFYGVYAISPKGFQVSIPEYDDKGRLRGFRRGWSQVKGGPVHREDDTYHFYREPISSVPLWIRHLCGTICLGPRWLPAGVQGGEPLDAILFDVDPRGDLGWGSSLDHDPQLRGEILDPLLTAISRVLGGMGVGDVRPSVWSSGGGGYWVGVWFDRCLSLRCLREVRSQIERDMLSAASSVEWIFSRHAPIPREGRFVLLDEGNLGPWVCRAPGGVNGSSGRRGRWIDPSSMEILPGFVEGLAGISPCDPSPIILSVDAIQGEGFSSPDAWNHSWQAPEGQGELPTAHVQRPEAAVNPPPSSHSYSRGSICGPFGPPATVDDLIRDIPAPLDGRTHAVLILGRQLREMVWSIYSSGADDGYDWDELCGRIERECYVDHARHDQRLREMLAEVAASLGEMRTRWPHRGEGTMADVAAQISAMADELSPAAEGFTREKVQQFLASIIDRWRRFGAVRYTATMLCEEMGWRSRTGAVGRRQRVKAAAFLRLWTDDCGRERTQASVRPLLKQLWLGCPGCASGYQPLWENWGGVVEARWKDGQVRQRERDTEFGAEVAAAEDEGLGSGDGEEQNAPPGGEAGVVRAGATVLSGDAATALEDDGSLSKRADGAAAPPAHQAPRGGEGEGCEGQDSSSLPGLDSDQRDELEEEVGRAVTAVLGPTPIENPTADENGGRWRSPVAEFMAATSGLPFPPKEVRSLSSLPPVSAAASADQWDAVDDDDEWTAQLEVGWRQMESEDW